MGRDEQIEEREVLDSIFPDEITDVSDTSYRIAIPLDVDVPRDDDDEVDAPIILLTVTYPPAYPDVAPELELSHPQHAAKPPYFSLPEDTPHLLSTLDLTISDSLGAAMIFSVHSALKEAVEALISSRIAEEQATKDKEAAKAEEQENAKFHGEAVTRERFLAWRKQFQEEQRLREEEEERSKEEGVRGKKLTKEEKKLTGKELWERGMAGKIEDEDEAEGEEKDALEEFRRLHVKS